MPRMDTNILTKTTLLAENLWLSYLNEDSVTVDATAGNGEDTLFLSRLSRKVYSFDIQQEALDNTADLLKKHERDNVVQIHDSHENMDMYVKEQPDLVVFNLGYLPDGNKSITTKTDSTLTALRKSLEMIRVNGLVSIVMYWGHEEGKKERQAILDFSEKLDSGKYHCVYLNMLNQKNCPPEIILITKKK